ncbi:MAG TPA: AtpZ/AtpI family protein [Syntrophales bacterium]|nr:AtpZ/AtpI family protein [Syntrophales bacterium]HQB31326.1 AtpZ/AtpI family protein [Syntrophales bacterium]HQN76923.1 AtpZ/AtpI family protein [Syntrophales bacterium]HQQ26930.1 AtpZ/AtpI family protein [Syntrophales bacterium]
MDRKERRRWIFTLAYASSLGIGMAIAIFGSLFVGAWIDRKLGTRNIFATLFFFIGVAAGFRNVFLFLKRYFPKEERHDGESGEDQKPPAGKD